VCIPSGATEVERKAVEDATYQAGAKEVAIIEEPVAAAIGAGIDISKACGNMIVDIGGGTTDIAVISLGGPVVSTSIKVAGDDFDDAVVRYMRRKHNLLIGERTGEDIKIQIGAAFKRPELLTMEVRGRNLVTGLPKTIVVTSDETLEALLEPACRLWMRFTMYWNARRRNSPRISSTAGLSLREAERFYTVWISSFRKRPAFTP
jgi:rod shape-determining protein MreB